MDHPAIPVGKITGFLLSQSHPIARAKASFFLGCGCTREEPQSLIDALIVHGKAHRAYSRPSPYGLKYIVEGAMDTPTRGPVLVCSVWMIETEGEAPVFVTAYPIKRAKT